MKIQKIQTFNLLLFLALTHKILSSRFLNFIERFTGYFKKPEGISESLFQLASEIQKFSLHKDTMFISILRKLLNIVVFHCFVASFLKIFGKFYPKPPSTYMLHNFSIFWPNFRQKVENFQNFR